MKKHPASASKAPGHQPPSISRSRARVGPIVIDLEVEAAVVTGEPEELPVPAVELKPVRFGYFNADAREVYLVGSFNNWDPHANPMTRDAMGDWSVELTLPPGEYHYRLMVDGEWRDDPNAQQTAMNVYGGFDAVVVV